MSVRIEASSKGLVAIRELVVSSGEMPRSVFDDIVVGVEQIGIDAMKASIALTTGEKSTGAMMDSVKGDLTKEGDTYVIRVGSDLPHSRFAASNITSTRMNRNVQVMPGKWRYIDIRPPMPAHPFLEVSVNAMVQGLQESLPMVMDKDFYEKYVKAKEKEGESP